MRGDVDDPGDAGDVVSVGAIGAAVSFALPRSSTAALTDPMSVLLASRNLSVQVPFASVTPANCVSSEVTDPAPATPPGEDVLYEAVGMRSLSPGAFCAAVHQLFGVLSKNV